MFNFKFLIKKINKILISINELIESFFNIFKDIKKIKKNDLRKINNKITISIGVGLILLVSYFLAPTIYNKDLVKSKIETQIYKKYNLEVKFEGNFSYGLFPKPHFFSDKLVIRYHENDIAISNFSKIYITINKLFSLNQTKIKNIYFQKTEFNTNQDNISFFLNLRDSFTGKDKIIFSKSKLFYKDETDDVVFIMKINKLNYSYDLKNFDKKILLDYEIFNIPFNVSIKKNLPNQKNVIEMKSKKIRLNVKNEFFNDQDAINGLLKVLVINKEKNLDYKIQNNILTFSSEDKNLFGKIFFKPFYLISNFNFGQIYLKNLLLENSLITNLIRSEIFNNQNLNANIVIKANSINGVNYLKDIELETYLNQGNFIIKNSNLNWQDSVIININNMQLQTSEDEAKFIGEINFFFKDLTKFYNYYQIRRNHRKNIKNMSLDFIFNLDQNKISIDNLKIDNKSSEELGSFLNKFNSQNQSIFNKFRFRNFVKNFFINYDG